MSTISDHLRATILSLKLISDRLKNIGNTGAKEALATANKTAIINAINNIDLSTVAKESAATANKEAIIAAVNNAQPDLSAVAKEATAQQAASDAAAAKTAAQAITGYALQGSDPTATNTKILLEINNLSLSASVNNNNLNISL